MQSIYILSDDGLNQAYLIKPRYRHMSRIGSCVRKIRVKFRFLPPIFYPGIFRGHKLVKIDQPVFVPYTAFTSEVRDSALGGYASAGKNDAPAAIYKFLRNEMYLFIHDIPPDQRFFNFLRLLSLLWFTISGFRDDPLTKGTFAPLPACQFLHILNLVNLVHDFKTEQRLNNILHGN